jgi:hypothetical protein
VNAGWIGGPGARIPAPRSALEELELKVGPLCRCLTCCCKPGQGHRHPDWIDAWGEEEDMSNEEVEAEPQIKAFTSSEAERAQWRLESAMRMVFSLIEKQPSLLNRADDTGVYIPANHLVVAARIVEMAQVIEPYLRPAPIDMGDETA